MATDFFERQRRARVQTGWLRLVFALALAVASVLVAAGAVLLLATIGFAGVFGRGSGGVLVDAFVHGNGGWLIAIWVLGFSLVTCGYTAWKLRGGGPALAQALRAREVHPESTHPAERQLLNIVAEMSLASRVPQPALYVLERENAINAFAAGRTLDDAVIGVTAGALRDLDRGELQAVIAHEFSHILHGDMALYTRLTAWLSGFFVIERFARRWRIDGESRKGLRTLLFWHAHLGFWFFHACGWISLTIGRALQAAICRRRETLADASAVQFTRNPGALKEAFLKIEAAEGAGRIQTRAATGMAHMFLASGERAAGGWFKGMWGGFLRTHPPMEERVRALDPRLTAAQFRAAVRETRKRQLNAAERAAAPVQVAGEMLRAAPPAPLFDDNTPPDLLCSRLNGEQQRQVLALHGEYANADGKLAALFAAGLLDATPLRARQQLLALAPVLGAGIAARVANAVNRLRELPPVSRLPLLMGLLPTLARLPDADRARMAKVARIVAADAAPQDAFRFALSRLMVRALVHAPPPAVARDATGREARPTLETETAAVSLLCALVAQCSGERAARAYLSGMDGLVPPLRRLPFVAGWPEAEAVDAALEKVARLPRAARLAVGAALVRVIGANGTVGAAEADLLRLVCSSIGIHVPATGQFKPEPTAEPGSALPAAGGS